MKEFLKIKVNNDLFINNDIDNGLYSFSRDVWNKGEQDVLEYMLKSQIISVDSYELCDFSKINEIPKELDERLFKSYAREREYCILEKILVYMYLKSKYDDIKINYNDCQFYIPKFDLYINHENQTAVDFIKLCMLTKYKSKIAVISSYGNYPCSIMPKKIALRIINIKNVFHYIYNENCKFVHSNDIKNTPLIDLKFPIQERYNLVRAYARYRSNLINDLKLHNQRSVFDKKILKLKYNEYDIDIVAENFIKQVMNKRAY